jgi:hypothetical protein
MPTNSLENPDRPRPALLALSAAEGREAKGRSERIRGTEVRANMAGRLGETSIPWPHPGLPKLNANRHTNLLAIALTRCKQRPTTLSNRHKIQFAYRPIPGVRKPRKNSFAATVRHLTQKRALRVTKSVILLGLKWTRASRRLDWEPARPVSCMRNEPRIPNFTPAFQLASERVKHFPLPRRSLWRGHLGTGAKEIAGTAS